MATFPLEQLETTYDYREMELKPQLALVYLQLGELIGPTRSPREAEWYFRRAVALGPQSVRAQLGLGTALFYQGRWQQAMAPLEQVLAESPHHPWARRLLTRCRWEVRRGPQKKT